MMWTQIRKGIVNNKMSEGNKRMQIGLETQQKERKAHQDLSEAWAGKKKSLHEEICEKEAEISCLKTDIEALKRELEVMQEKVKEVRTTPEDVAPDSGRPFGGMEDLWAVVFSLKENVGEIRAFLEKGKEREKNKEKEGILPTRARSKEQVRESRIGVGEKVGDEGRMQGPLLLPHWRPKKRRGERGVGGSCRDFRVRRRWPLTWEEGVFPTRKRSGKSGRRFTWGMLELALLLLGGR